MKPFRSRRIHFEPKPSESWPRQFLFTGGGYDDGYADDEDDFQFPEEEQKQEGPLPAPPSIPVDDTGLVFPEPQDDPVVPEWAYPSSPEPSEQEQTEFVVPENTPQQDTEQETPQQQPQQDTQLPHKLLNRILNLEHLNKILLLKNLNQSNLNQGVHLEYVSQFNVQNLHSRKLNRNMMRN